MPEKTAEENLLLAAKAVELQIISAADCVNAIGKWNNDPSRTLLTFVEQQANLDDEKRRQLKELFEAFTDSMAIEIADSIDDSVFDKLNDVLANVNSDQVQANVASLGTRVGSILQLVSEHRRFEIIAEHARGGLGEVLLAQDRQLNRKVALKRIREKWAQDNNARIRFQLEAEITGRLEHPGVVPVYALGQRPDGEIYYAMRFIRGDSLEAAVTEFHAAPDRRSTDRRSAGFRNLLRRFVDVCNTISYAHSRGIIHRDLKPANIMLGKYGETLVVDWGLAKQVGVEEVSPVNVVDNKESRIQPDSGSGSTPTQYGSAVGTPQYMSPEQATGRVDRMGPLTDVFGLGATLYHLLTNKPPQSNDSLEQILERVEHGDFAKPRDINPAVPRPLEAICLKALALRPSERYASAAELGADIDRWLADEPVNVCRDSLIVRTTRWVRKNQTLAATTAVATLLLIVGGIVGNEIQHKREQREAEIELAAQSRVARLRDSLKATNDIVQRQIDNGQFATAVSVLHSEIETLKDEAGFESERLELEAKGNRLSNIDKSQQLALTAQKANFLAQDADEIIATVNSLDALGVWEHADWWNHLPADDLNANQHDQLKQMVYRNLLLLASTYTKLTGMRTLAASGGKMPASLSGKLGAIFSQEGKDEARATLKICDMANRFQFAESLAWYRGVAAFRLLKGRMIPPHRLKRPRNSADAYELGIMTVTRAVVKDFPFRRYRGVEDDLMSARETMNIASEMSPEHYFTHLILGQSQYLTAAEAVNVNDPEAWKLYETSRQTFGRCISLQPDLPFAYADLSTVCLREYEVLPQSKLTSQADIDRVQRDLLDSSLKFAIQAVERGPKDGWVYWHYGHALAATGQMEDALQAYARAINLSFRFREDSNASIVNMDNIRGLDRIITETTKLISEGNEDSLMNAVLAGAYIKQGKYEEARPFAEAACEVDAVDSFAWVVRGQLALHDHQFDLAMNCFKEIVAPDVHSGWSAIGMGLCCEQMSLLPTAQTWFLTARELIETDYHAATVELGLCRVQMRMGDYAAAAASLLKARELYPACVVEEIQILAEELNAAPVLTAIESSRHISIQDIIENNVILTAADIPVHNGDFELSLSRYWNNPGASAWHVQGQGVSLAEIDRQMFYAGQGSLHIRTTEMTANASATTQQTITVEQKSVYEISVRAKSESCAPDGLFIVVANEDAEVATNVVTLPAGQYDWTRVTGTFETPEFSRGEPLAPMLLSLISKGAADVWLDDIVIRRVADVREKLPEIP